MQPTLLFKFDNNAIRAASAIVTHHDCPSPKRMHKLLPKLRPHLSLKRKDSKNEKIFVSRPNGNFGSLEAILALRRNPGRSRDNAVMQARAVQSNVSTQQVLRHQTMLRHATAIKRPYLRTAVKARRQILTSRMAPRKKLSRSRVPIRSGAGTCVGVIPPLRRIILARGPGRSPCIGRTLSPLMSPSQTSF
jgi:hypothetical protein